MTVVHDVVDWIEGAVGALTTADWVLVAVAVAALIWIWVDLHAHQRLGPVEVMPVDHDGVAAEKADVLALTASLREQLALSGLTPPPLVPAGAPRANLIAAVEASPVGQAAWIAKLLDLVPWPSPFQFSVSGTLRAQTSTQGASGENVTWPVGISVWVRSNKGQDLLETVGADSYDDAVRQAAERVFIHVCSEAVSVFPTWTRWTKQEALRQYLTGLGALRARQWDRARKALETAASQESHNLLPSLQLANLTEGQVSRQAAPSLEELSTVLARYRELGRQQPLLAAPHYRASILASRLAAACEQLPQAGDDELAGVRRRLDLDPSDVPKQLRKLSRKESSRTKFLLRGWYIPVRQVRLRHQYELTGYARRALKRAVEISRHCVRVRIRMRDNRWRATCELLGRRITVWLYHAQLGRAAMSWQGEYNLGCFYALLASREQEVPAPSTGIRHWPNRAYYSQRRRRKREKRFRRRAFHHLNRAIREEDGALATGWVKSDPDLVNLHGDGRLELDDSWELFLARLSSSSSGDDSLPAEGPLPVSADSTDRPPSWTVAGAFAVLTALVWISWLMPRRRSPP